MYQNAVFCANGLKETRSEIEKMTLTITSFFPTMVLYLFKDNFCHSSQLYLNPWSAK